MHYKHCENMWPLRLRLHWTWSSMLLGYNVSHMGQHFSIKQSEMKRTGALVFARRLLSFQRLGLTSSALFSGISALEFFFGCFLFFTVWFLVAGPEPFLRIIRALIQSWLKRQKNDQTPDERFKMKNISVKQLGAFFIAAGILDESS